MGAERILQVTPAWSARRSPATRRSKAVGRNSTARQYLTATTFFNNSASLGGGVLFYGAGPRQVVNSLFAGNTAITSGTAVYVYNATPLTLIYTTITSPTLNSKSAIAAGGGTVDITNTIISGHAIGIEVTGSGTVSEDYNLFYGNGADSSGSVNSGGHSLVGDPAFVNPAVFNYHLTAASAAINRGVDAGVYVDFEGDPRPRAGGFDIGYDESPFPSQYELTVSKSGAGSDGGWAAIRPASTAAATAVKRITTALSSRSRPRRPPARPSRAGAGRAAAAARAA